MTIYRAGTIFDGNNVLGSGTVRTENGRILQVVPDDAAGSSLAHPVAHSGEVDLGDVILAPGFVDIHSHGGGGAAFTDGYEPARTVIETHRAEGTTSIMASLVTDTLENLESQIRALQPLYDAGEILGVHLEGPWLSEKYKGAHDPQLLRDPTEEDVARLCAAGSVRMVTLAVERPGGIEAVRWLAEHGVIAAPGHSDASFEQVKAAIDAGARDITHLFNAMRPVHHRQPGPVIAALETPGLPVELIADGVHTHKVTVKFVFDAKGRDVILVTDAMAAAGSPDGDYMLGPLEVEVRNQIARLKSNGAIAGSTLTLSRAVRFATFTAGVDTWLALHAATARPAQLLGRDAEIGRIIPGAYADLVVESPTLHVQHVIRRGEQVK
ncbi:MAG: N-acetylglucosamine-6-phosphate deacetylase [Actinomycetaceae bacterium]|nr:N-acetylglucosamine-6-phosphate deacetylase [Actinomycetaceae bacterium]